MLVSPSCAIVSTDEIRTELAGGEYVHSKEMNDQVFEIFNRRLRKHLDYGEDVVADATNLPARRRRDVLAVGRMRGSLIHAIVFTNVAQAILRNQEREGPTRVPNGQMLGFVSLFEEARRDILEEGFDSITYIEGT
jgi:predicted kinase